MTPTATKFNVGAFGSAPYTRMYLGFAADPSTDAIVTWHDTRANNTLQYRALGASEWTNIYGLPSREIPLRSTRVHSAHLTALTPGTTYEVRPHGSLSHRKFRTLAPAADIKIAIASDIQSDDAFATNSRHRRVTANILADNPDLLLMLGDYTGWDGKIQERMSAFYDALLDEVSTDFVRSDGTMIPLVAAPGNHDAFGNGGGGDFFGQGEIPYLPKVFDTLWRTGANCPNAKGWGWFTIGTKILVLVLNTNHGDLLADQKNWFAQTLAAKAANYDHVFVAGHFSPRYTNTSPNAAINAMLRDDFWAVAQNYPNIKFWAAGHEHKQGAGHPAKMIGGTWTLDPDGITLIGFGGWGNPAGTTHPGFVTGWPEYICARDIVTGIPTNPLTPDDTANDEASQGHWLLTYTATTVTAANINITGQPYFTKTSQVK